MNIDRLLKYFFLEFDIVALLEKTLNIGLLFNSHYTLLFRNSSIMRDSWVLMG